MELITLNNYKAILSIFLVFILIFQVSIVSASEIEKSTNSAEVTSSVGLTDEQLNPEIIIDDVSEEQPNKAETSGIPSDQLLNEANEENTYTQPEEEQSLPPEVKEVISPYINGNGKVIQTTPYYLSSSKGFEKAGTLEKGTILSPTKVTANYFIVTANKKSFYIPRTALTSTDEETNLEAHIQGNFPRSIVAEIDAPFEDKAGNILGTVAKGEQVNLHMINGSRGVIERFGKRVYVNLVDFYHTNQVEPKKNISYKEMEYYLKVFSNMYPEFTELVKIGSSVQGRALYALKVGTGSKEILMDASLHAREHMTTNVLLEMIDEYTYHYLKGKKFSSMNVKTILSRVSIWFVPMMNPDGVTLVQTRVNASSTTKKLNNGSSNYNRWKANIRGIDLNRNFDGGWEKKASAASPSYKNYKGAKAFSEPESQALRNFVAQHHFKSYISYHSSGSILYYYHYQKSTALTRDLSVAKMIGKATGYKIMSPTGEAGSGASTDWFIMNYRMPGITIEIAPYGGETVVPLKYWDSVWKKNKTIGLLAANEANSR